MSDPTHDDLDDARPAPIVAPRWYNISLMVLSLAASAYLLVVGQPIFAAIFFVGAFVAAVVEFWWQPRARRRGKAWVSNASYGSNSLLGLLYVGLGVVSLTVTTSPLFGVLMLALGILSLIAFGPGYLRTRRAR